MTVNIGQDSLTLDAVKSQLNVDYNTDDILIEAYISLSLEYMRHQLNNTITQNTYEVVTMSKITQDEVYLPTRPYKATIVLNTKNGESWTVPNEMVLDNTIVVGNTTNTPGASYTPEQNYKVNVQELLSLFCQRGHTKADVEDAAKLGQLDVIFETGLSDTYLPNLARVMVIGDWLHNREDSQYYTQNSINHGAKSIISMLQGHSL